MEMKISRRNSNRVLQICSLLACHVTWCLGLIEEDELKEIKSNVIMQLEREGLPVLIESTLLHFISTSSQSPESKVTDKLIWLVMIQKQTAAQWRLCSVTQIT